MTFQIMLGGNITESVEGTCKANIIYQLEATVTRRKLVSDLRTYKHLRIIQTIEVSTLGLLYIINVKNI